MTVSYAGVGEAADKVLADAEARAQSPARAGDLVPDVFQPRHPRLQCAHGRLQMEVALGLAPEVGLHAAQPQLPVLAAPPAGLVVEVAHAPVLERRDLVLRHAGHRGVAAADEVAVRGRGGGGPPVPPHPRQLHRDLARRIINWPPSFPENSWHSDKYLPTLFSQNFFPRKTYSSCAA